MLAVLPTGEKGGAAQRRKLSAQLASRVSAVSRAAATRRRGQEPHVPAAGAGAARHVGMGGCAASRESGRDALLPLACLAGCCLVVSPLVALMDDQLAGLPACLAGRAAALSGSQTREQVEAALRGAERGAVKLLYVAPEKLLTPWLLAALRRLQLSMVGGGRAALLSARVGVWAWSGALTRLRAWPCHLTGGSGRGALRVRVGPLLPPRLPAPGPPAASRAAPALPAGAHRHRHGADRGRGGGRAGATARRRAARASAAGQPPAAGRQLPPPCACLGSCLQPQGLALQHALGSLPCTAAMPCGCLWPCRSCTWRPALWRAVQPATRCWRFCALPSWQAAAACWCTWACSGRPTTWRAGCTTVPASAQAHTTQARRPHGRTCSCAVYVCVWRPRDADVVP
jgi:hypothetical protein